MYCVYKHLNENFEVIYVGKSKDMKTRQISHKENASWKKEIFKIEYAEVTDSMLMDIYEKYYISCFDSCFCFV